MVYVAYKGIKYKDKYPDKTVLVLCPGCNEYKPIIKFIDRANRKFKWCKVCRKKKVGGWLTRYYNGLKDDPVKLLAALRHFDEIKPDIHASKGGLGDYYKWLMAKNSFMARMGLIDKKEPFDIVTYVERKVKYGRLTQEEAREVIERWQKKESERVKRETGGVIKPSNSTGDGS